MSQLTALLSLLHNGLIDLIVAASPTANPTPPRRRLQTGSVRARRIDVDLPQHHPQGLDATAMHPAIYAAYSGPARASSIARRIPAAIRRSGAHRTETAGKFL